MTFIYVLRCPESGEVRYVGKTTNKKHRIRQHLHEGKSRKIISHKCNWISSLLERGLKPIFEIDVEVPDAASWQDVERARIAHYRALGCRLTNTTDGGDGATDLSPESRKKLSQRQKTIYADPQRRAAAADRLRRMKRDPAIAARHATAVRESCNRPEYLAGLSDRVKAQMAKPEVRARQSETMKRLCSDPEFVARRAAAGKAKRSTPEYRRQQSERSRTMWADPAFRERMIASRALVNARPEFRKLLSDRARHSQATPEARLAKSARAREAWADPEIRERQTAAIRAACSKSVPG